MSILSTLLQFGGLAAAPFSGGASLALTGVGKGLDMAGKAGSVLGAQQAGNAQGQLQQGNLQNNYDRNAIDLYGTQQGEQDKQAQLDLQHQQYDAQHRSSAGKEALIAMLLGSGGGAQNVSMAGIPQATVSGGMSAAMKSNPQILELLKSIASKGQTDQATPSTFTGGTVLPAPTLTPLPQTSKSDGILSAIAKIAQLAGTAAPMFHK